MQGIPGLLGSIPGMSMFPPVAAAAAGNLQARYRKEPFKLTAYKVKVFDMSKAEDVEAYCALMARLMPLCQDAKCVVSKNELQVLNSGNGSGWFRYVEWFEYELNQTSLTGVQQPQEEESAFPQAPGGIVSVEPEDDEPHV